MIKKVFFTILMLIAFGTPAIDGVNAVATLPWIGSIAREIGKDRGSVTVLVKPNQDPHFVEAKPSMISAASKADMLLYNGLDLEIGYLPLIIRSSRNSRIQPGQKGNLDCSRYVDAIEKPHSEIDSPAHSRLPEPYLPDAFVHQKPDGKKVIKTLTFRPRMVSMISIHRTGQDQCG